MSAEPAGRVLIASNRGPVSFSLGDDGRLTSRRGAGGVVSGLAALAGRAEVLWVCAALNDADRAAARAAPDGRLDVSPAGDAVPHGPESMVRMLDIPAPVFDRAYNGIANSTLWFIHHLLYDTPNQPLFGLAFRREWESFRAYNAAFADALAQGAGPRRAGARAMVQDYHLTLVPRMLAERRPDLAIAHFSHTPWAPPDYFALLPDDVAREVLEGILGADHAGFHARRWASAFLDCCEAVLGAQVDRVARTVRHAGHTTTVGVHALGVDAPQLRARAAADDVQAHVTALTEVAGDRKLIVRIDRTELSKNIVRGLAAYRELLITWPQWRGQVTHLAFAYPSRHDLPEYREYTASVLRLAREIVDEFGTADWDPLVLQVNDDYPRSLAAYQLADVLLVNPVRDGMNLVAKEGPLLSERACAVVLSREAGAAAELAEGALLVNPYDVSATAQALHEALSMNSAERNRRGALLAQASAACPPQQWLASQLSALEAAAKAEPQPAQPAGRRPLWARRVPGRRARRAR
ncbi:MAG TPA: trehalose-6-phosphate synthase [Streptosporangiaceae bacterium]|jgi:trehalose 6-phosphate synthase|nr:trehalose-6-phosphate synthase [Streptosporangiaceae bacterium]